MHMCQDRTVLLCLVADFFKAALSVLPQFARKIFFLLLLLTIQDSQALSIPTLSRVVILQGLDLFVFLKLVFLDVVWEGPG